MRSAPTTVRDNLLAAALWKALDIDLIPPRLIRVICYPLPIWREGRCRFIRLRLKNRERRDRHRGRRYRQDPHVIVIRFLAYLIVDNDAHVSRPVRGGLEVI